MKFILSVFLITLQMNIFAQDSLSVQKCEYLDHENKVCEPLPVSIELEDLIDKEPTLYKKWSLFLSFGPFVSYYHTTSLYLHNKDTDIKISKIEPKQRTSFGHYEIFNKDETDPGQFLDEPQNKFTLEISNGKFFIGLEYTHPKILYHNGENEQIVNIKGTINGEEVDEKNVPLNNYFSEVTSTFGNANADIFAGRVFNLLKQDTKHKLSLYLGLGFGATFSSGIITENFDSPDQSTEKPAIELNGFALTTKTKLKYTFPKGRFNLSLSHDFSYNKVYGQLDDYKSRTTLLSHRFHFGIGVKILDFKKRKNKRRSKMLNQ